MSITTVFLGDSSMDGDPGNNIALSVSMQHYFSAMHTQLNNCYDIASAARKQGRDPTLTVEIPQALDLASRVEQLVGPENIAPIIRKITKKLGNRELVSLEIAKYIAKGNSKKFSSVEDALDQAIRTGLAILTEGVLVAPLEGIAEVRLGKNRDRSTAFPKNGATKKLQGFGNGFASKASFYKNSY